MVKTNTAGIYCLSTNNFKQQSSSKRIYKKKFNCINHINAIKIKFLNRIKK